MKDVMIIYTWICGFDKRPIIDYIQTSLGRNCIGGVMVSMLVSSAVDRGFEPWSGQTKDYKIGICCFSAKHAALRRKSKDWSALNQNIWYMYNWKIAELALSNNHSHTR